DLEPCVLAEALVLDLVAGGGVRAPSEGDAERHECDHGAGRGPAPKKPPHSESLPFCRRERSGCRTSVGRRSCAGARIHSVSPSRRRRKSADSPIDPESLREVVRRTDANPQLVATARFLRGLIPGGDPRKPDLPEPMERLVAEVQPKGPSTLGVFGDSGAAVSAALEAQRGISKIKVDGYRPTQRAGVHRGNPRKVKRDFLGVDVNIAARVGDCAKGGEVLVSEPVREELDGRRYR